MMAHPSRLFFTGLRPHGRVRQHDAVFPLSLPLLRDPDAISLNTLVVADMAGLEQHRAEPAETLPEGHGRLIATGALSAQRGALVARYGDNPDGHSHGETSLSPLISPY